MGFKQVDSTNKEKEEVAYGELSSGDLFIVKEDLAHIDGKMDLTFVRIMGDEEDSDEDRWSTYLFSGTMYALEKDTPVVRVEVEILGVKLI